MKNWASEIQELAIYYQSFSGKMPDLEKELERLIKVDDEIGVLVSSRRCLEVIVNELCNKESIKLGKTIPLKGIIDKLNKENKVPAHINTTMLNLNNSSTYGAHAKEFDSRQVRTVLINLTTILEWYLGFIDYESIKQTKEGNKKQESDIEQNIFIKKVKDNSSKFKTWKMATYIAALIIVVLGILYLIKINERVKNTQELEKSIAVLPFENWSSDEEFAHIGDAMTDELILQLQYIENFDRVLSRTSTFQYKNNKKSIPKIAEELGVSYIIEGSILRKHDNVSITVQVIRAINEDHIWAEEYTGKWKDIFTIQDKIAKQVAEELKMILSPEEIQKINKKPTENQEAYNLYLRGRFFWYQRTEEGLNNSIKYFNKALEIDTNYALAYAGLADAYFIIGWYRWHPKKDAYNKAKKYAIKALSINNNISEAHATLGTVFTYHEWNWKKAEKEFKLAVSLNPNDAPAHMYYSELLNILGRNKEARKIINQAVKLNPHIFIYNGLSGIYYYHNEEYQKAIEESSIAYEASDRLYLAITILKCYVKLEMDNKVIEQIKNILLKNEPQSNHKSLDKIFLEKGTEGAIYWFIDWLRDNYPDRANYRIASLYAVIGDSQNAIIYLEKCMDVGADQVLRINTNPDFNFIRTEPGFVAIVKELGLYNPDDIY